MIIVIVMHGTCLILRPDGAGVLPTDSRFIHASRILAMFDAYAKQLCAGGAAARSRAWFAFHDLRVLHAQWHAGPSSQQPLVVDVKIVSRSTSTMLPRAALSSLSDDSDRLASAFHHEIVDGRCINLLINSLQRIYEDLLARPPPHRAPRPLYKH